MILYLSALLCCYNMLTIFSHCDATNGPLMGPRDQRQQDHEPLHRVHKPKAEVRQVGDLPSFLRTARPIHEKECQFVAPGAGWSGREALEIRVWKPK